MAKTERALANDLLDAVAARDFEALSGLCEPEVVFRALLPSRVLEHSARDEVGAAFRRWFGDWPSFRLIDATIGEVGPRTYLRYRFAVRGADGPGDAKQVEQHVFLAGAERITSLDLMCSGFQRY
jgi:ketosteroid isomerase-like protein